MQEDVRRPFEVSDDFRTCWREARHFTWLWLIQSALMIGVFLALGYDRSDDPFGFPLGLPTWFVVGVLLPSLVFLVISIVMALHMEEVPVA